MGRARLRRVSLATVLLFAAEARIARYADADVSQPSRLPSRVRVEASSTCVLPPLDVQVLLSLLEIELGGAGVAMATTEEAAPGLPSVTVDLNRCEPGAREVRVSVGNPATKRSVQRTIAIGDTPTGARPRLLALAVVELLRGSWQDLALADPPADPSAPPLVSTAPPKCADACPPTPPPPTVPSVRSPARLWGGLDGRVSVRAGQPTTAVDGARVGASIALPPRPLRLTVDAGAGYAHGSDPLGTVDIVAVTGSLGLAGDLSLGRGGLELGVKVEPGAGWASGHPLNPHDHGVTALNFVLVTAAEAAARAPVSERVFLFVCASVGAVLHGVEFVANGRSTAGLAGGMLGVRAGIGYDL